MSHIFSGESEDSGSDLESLKYFDYKIISRSSVVQMCSEVDDLYSKRQPDGFARKPVDLQSRVHSLSSVITECSIMDDLYSKRPPDGFSRKPDDSRSETYILSGVVRYSSKVDDLYRKRRPDGFAGEPKSKIPEICRTGAPHRPPSSYPPRPPRPPDSEKL